jgi:hypothetical protein
MIERNWARNLTSLVLVLTILTATSAVALAFSDKSSMGEIIVSGNSDGNGSYVLLDGQKAYNGRTFVSSGIIKTEEVGATIKLKGLGMINLAPKTSLNLNIADKSISGTLAEGKIKVLNSKGVKVDIETADSKISNKGDQKNIFAVDLSSGLTQANSEIGTILLNNGENTTAVTPKQDDDDDDDDNSIVPLVLVFSGIVATAALLVFLNDDEDELQTISAIF